MILIKGMEMPSKCIECRLMRRCGKDDLDYVCMPASVYVEDLTNAYKPRPEYCPLVPIPSHGRLIDASYINSENDRFFDMSQASGEFDEHASAYAYSLIANILALAPTVIPAE